MALSGGTEEFWVVDAESRTVRVMRPGESKLSASGESIPLRMFGGTAILVDGIFGV